MYSLSIYSPSFEWKIGLEVLIATFSLKYSHLQAMDDAECIFDYSVLQNFQSLFEIAKAAQLLRWYSYSCMYIWFYVETIFCQRMSVRLSLMLITL